MSIACFRFHIRPGLPFTGNLHTLELELEPSIYISSIPHRHLVTSPPYQIYLLTRSTSILSSVSSTGQDTSNSITDHRSFTSSMNHLPISSHFIKIIKIIILIFHPLREVLGCTRWWTPAAGTSTPNSHYTCIHIIRTQLHLLQIIPSKSDTEVNISDNEAMRQTIDEHLVLQISSHFIK